MSKGKPKGNNLLWLRDNIHLLSSVRKPGQCVPALFKMVELLQASPELVHVVGNSANVAM